MVWQSLWIFIIISLHCFLTTALEPPRSYEPKLCRTVHPSNCCNFASDIPNICYKRCMTIPCDLIGFVSDNQTELKQFDPVRESTERRFYDLHTFSFPAILELTETKKIHRTKEISTEKRQRIAKTTPERERIIQNTFSNREHIPKSLKTTQNTPKRTKHVQKQARAPKSYSKRERKTPPKKPMKIAHVTTSTQAERAKVLQKKIWSREGRKSASRARKELALPERQVPVKPVTSEPKRQQFIQNSSPLTQKMKKISNEKEKKSRSSSTKDWDEKNTAERDDIYEEYFGSTDQSDYEDSLDGLSDVLRNMPNASDEGSSFGEPFTFKYLRPLEEESHKIVPDISQEATVYEESGSQEEWARKPASIFDRYGASARPPKTFTSDTLEQPGDPTVGAEYAEHAAHAAHAGLPGQWSPWSLHERGEQFYNDLVGGKILEPSDLVPPSPFTTEYDYGGEGSVLQPPPMPPPPVNRFGSNKYGRRVGRGRGRVIAQYAAIDPRQSMGFTIPWTEHKKPMKHVNRNYYTPKSTRSGYAYTRPLEHKVVADNILDDRPFLNELANSMSTQYPLVVPSAPLSPLINQQKQYTNNNNNYNNNNHYNRNNHMRQASSTINEPVRYTQQQRRPYDYSKHDNVFYAANIFRDLDRQAEQSRQEQRRQQEKEYYLSPYLNMDMDTTSEKEMQQELAKCCEISGVPHECLVLCDYNSNRDMISSLINSGDRHHCLASVTVAILCANQQRDNTVCCENLTTIGPQCHRFCDPSRYAEMKRFGPEDYICGKHWDTVMTCNKGGVRYEKRKRRKLAS